MTPARSLAGVIHSLSLWMNRLATYILLLMMLLTVADVFLRYFMSKPILGSTEITEYMMVCLVLGCPYCILARKAIRMQLFISKLRGRTQKLLEALTDAIGLVGMVFLSWQLLSELKFSFSSRVSSTILDIPSFPFVGVLWFSTAMICLTLCVNIMQDFLRWMRGAG